jgi:ATP-dependent Zn protease
MLNDLQTALTIVTSRYDLSSMDIGTLNVNGKIRFMAHAQWQASNYTNEHGHKVASIYADTLPEALQHLIQALNEKMAHDLANVFQLAA